MVNFEFSPKKQVTGSCMNLRMREWFKCFSLICDRHSYGVLLYWPEEMIQSDQEEIQSVEEMVLFDQRQWQWFNQRKQLLCAGFLKALLSRDPNCLGRVTQAESSRLLPAKQPTQAAIASALPVWRKRAGKFVDRGSRGFLFGDFTVILLPRGPGSMSHGANIYIIRNSY